MMMNTSLLLSRRGIAAGLLFVLSFSHARAGDERMPYRTFLVTRSMAHERLMPYLEAARPEIVQMGHFGPMFHGMVDNEKSKGSPLMLPVVGERPFLDFQRVLYRKVHDLGLKAVGHFTLIKAYGNWEEKSGFVDYYENRWPEDLLGPKPHPDLRELLQRTVDGVPIQTSRYDQAQIAFCLSSPAARQMFKQMLKLAVVDGADGVVTNYNYHFECACPHCQTGFRGWLGEHFSPEEIQARLGVSDLKNHVFPTIPARISGYPDPATATDLDWLAMRWGAEAFQRHFSEIFVEYGRSLKPDLLVAQWNHLGNAGTGNERMFLPGDRWGKGEDYVWESGGASFVGKELSLAAGKAGDAWLSCLLTRELSGGKPFVMGKYDGLRLAVNMAEGYAIGGLGMGRYMRFEDPAGYATLVRGTQFMHRHRALYEGAEMVADVALVLPRQTAWKGRSGAWNEFRSLGQAMANDQILFEVVADENLTAERLAGYPAVILPKGTELSEVQAKAIEIYRALGGRLIDQARAEVVTTLLGEGGGSSVDAPWTVRAAAYSQMDRLLLHLVNYDRDEGQTKVEKAVKPENERPRAVAKIGTDLRLPEGRKVAAVSLHRMDRDEPVELAFRQSGQRVAFEVPEMLVYALVEVSLKP